MKKIVDYCVVPESKVKEMLEKGWFPFGGACCMPTERWKYTEDFWQAMVKYED